MPLTKSSNQLQSQLKRFDDKATGKCGSFRKAPAENGTHSALGPPSWCDAYGEYLHSFAYSRLSDSDAAEEVVQDTLLGGLQSFSQFKGQATELSWLMGILRNKIADYCRRQARNRRDDLSYTVAGYRDRCTYSEYYLPAGAAWSAIPSDELERQEFWEVVDESMTDMPAGLATAFRLSVIECQETTAICQQLNITSGNLWVRLHRARNHLALSVDDRWNKPRVGREQA